MSKITILPPDISQKIAAGEVIERPFSAVKELVENALDAEASEIKIELLDGGKKLIRVTDNGCGMSAEDAQLCFERHSTSKVGRVEDLSRISTLGFRGEALPSIAAVSRVSLRTADGEAGKGTQVEKEGNQLARVSEVAFPKGTAVEVRELFFNLPARRKFLRSERSELNMIVRHVTLISLAYPEVRFSLTHGKKQVFDYPRVAALRERIFQVFGKSQLERLMEIGHEEEGKRLHGYASLPPSGRREKSQQFFCVNRRPVRDRTLLAALNQAYRPFLEKDRFAEAFLFLSCPYHEVDVNVHPAKAEVRFRDSRPYFQLVLHAVEQAMLSEKGIKELRPVQLEARPEWRTPVEPGVQALLIGEEREPRWKHLPSSLPGGEKAWPRVLGQYRNAYIVAVSEEGLFIIDQHNAHERVLFEQYEETDKKKSWPRKMALLPLLVELSPSQVLSLEDNRPLLEEAGFLLEAMGGRSYALKEYPALFRDEEAKEVFLSILEEVSREKAVERKNRMLATLACRTAVKAGEPLSGERMDFLVEALFKARNSSLCPHGRPIMVRIGKREIERGLKRG